MMSSETRPASQVSVLICEDRAPLLLPVTPFPTDTPVLEGLTPVSDERTVGEGTGPSAPFMAMALEERAAKPTEAGLARKTEYTFFYSQSRISSG